MLIYIVFFMIFVGVTAALYQVYEIHYNINVGNDKKLSKADKSHLQALSDQAKTATQTHARSDFDQAAANVLGPNLDRDIVLKAFAEEEKGVYAIPLLRRKARLRFNGEGGVAKSSVNKSSANIISVKVRHWPFWKTTLPRVDIRAALITLVILNCFLVQLLAAMSVYTLGYPMSTPWLAWLNDPMAVMLLIYTLIFTSLLISAFDRYMHDLYQLGKLFQKKAV
ncbi:MULTISPECIES: hypothetical protein [unclassified Halomonas]|uniref:hypothetical protein n=1 Tax=unclassified Halomonas TaxID=2609666 RepID=UPI0007D8E2C7|nr:MULTISPECIES: hypothetical protein [unclassified Halomonas]MBT2786376.1 hypothetical protein [Halomonas sp. ISL-106]MBT2797398.1 hypothetical protein [Halomonas sp. ISL-104]OAL58763.1 hypothetical protein A6R74_07715 [Halomonas sp. ALS9]